MGGYTLVTRIRHIPSKILLPLLSRISRHGLRPHAGRALFFTPALVLLVLLRRHRRAIARGELDGPSRTPPPRLDPRFRVALDRIQPDRLFRGFDNDPEGLL